MTDNTNGARQPYFIGVDVAVDLGIHAPDVRAVAEAAGVTPRCSGRICRYSPEDVARMRATVNLMRELRCGPAMVGRIQAYIAARKRQTGEGTA